MKIRLNRKVAQRARFYAGTLLSRRSIITFALSCVGVVLYYLVSWNVLQVFFAKLVIVILPLAGYFPLRDGNLIVLEGVRVRIAPVCTYVPLILAGLPFVWRGDRLMYDVLRGLFFIATVAVANTARICLAIVLLSERVPYKYAHDLINHLTYGPIVVLLSFLWIRAVTRSLAKQKSDPLEDRV